MKKHGLRRNGKPWNGLSVLVGLFLVLLSLGLPATPSLAVDLTLEWKAVTGATGYRVYLSTDNGATWDAGADIGPGNPINGHLTATYIGAPESGLILLKISAYNATAETVTDWQGVWYDHTRRPLGYTTGMGIN